VSAASSTDRVALTHEGGIVGIDGDDDAGDLRRKLHQIACT